MSSPLQRRSRITRLLVKLASRSTVPSVCSESRLVRQLHPIKCALLHSVCVILMANSCPAKRNCSRRSLFKVRRRLRFLVAHFSLGCIIFSYFREICRNSLLDENIVPVSAAVSQSPFAHCAELENKLAITQSECEKLRQSLSSKESELSNIKCLLEEQIAVNGSQLSQLQQLMQAAVISGSTAFPQFEQQRLLHDQLQAHQRNLQLQQQQVSLAQAQVQEALGDQMQVDSYASPSVSSPASGIATPVTPATPLMAGASTPSAMDEDDMDVSGTDDIDIDASTAAKHLLMEKLKKLGGPPSDVYYPYWPGFIMHPAFLEKEDWINMTSTLR